MQVQLEPFGFPEADAEMAGIGRRAEDPRPAFEAIAREFPHLERSAFGGTPSLIDTGALLRSMTEHPDLEQSPEGLSIGTNVFEGRFWWQELLAPVTDTVLDRWAELTGLYVIEGGTGTALVGVIGA